MKRTQISVCKNARRLPMLLCTLCVELPAFRGSPRSLKPLGICSQSIQLGETHFKVNMSTEMRQVFDSYADRMGIQASSVGFLLGYSEIGPEQTVRELALKDDDTINCFTKHLPDSTGANIVVHIKNLVRTTKYLML